MCGCRFITEVVDKWILKQKYYCIKFYFLHQILRMTDGTDINYGQLCICTGGKPKVKRRSNVLTFLLNVLLKKIKTRVCTVSERILSHSVK